MNLLEIHDVVKTYQDKTAVDHVSLEIPTGGIFGLLGPNGAGKTSLIRMLNRITFPDSGRILFNGEPLAEKHQQQIGYMPEERGLYKKMEVGDYLVYILQLKGMRRKHAASVAHEWLVKFDLAEWRDKKVDKLSKGMQQKVQFIQTIAHEPKLLILDEPFSGLDPINAQKIEDTIVELSQKGVTVLFSTHRMEQVEEFCKRIALIHRGKVVLNGELDAIRQQYRKEVYLVEAEVPFEAIELPPGVEQLSHEGATASFKLHKGATPQALLTALNAKATLRRFELQLPRLREVFIETVGRGNLTEAEAAEPVLA